MGEADAVVIGAGVMGAAAAWRLAMRGRDVVVLERFTIGHPNGSSHGRARVVRASYTDAGYARMMAEAWPLWREIEARSERPLLRTTGMLEFGPQTYLEQVGASLTLAGFGHEILEGPEVAERFPDVALAPGDAALFEPDAGVVDAEAAVRSFAAAGGALGARFLEGTPATGLRVRDDGVAVATEGETWTAPVAVVAAGAWIRTVLEGTGIDLPVAPSRETVSFYRTADEERLPVLVEWGDVPIYALPGNGEGLKVGWHHSGVATDPDVPGPPSDDVLARQSAWVAEHFPRIDPRPTRVETCLYTNTDDERFLLERHGPVVVGSACSGHAFKFAPLIGERLAQLAEG